MALAIASYEKLQSLRDDESVLNLAWTLDEREYLSIDLNKVISQELADEARHLPFVSSYFVKDPYGEECLQASVSGLFPLAGKRYGITCGAGVNSLLHGLAKLAENRPTYVMCDVYPDFPHWVERLGGKLVSHHDGPAGNDAIANVRAMGASVVLLERPMLTGEDVSLENLRALCEGVASCGSIVLVDESYANYYPPSFSAISLVPEVENLAVLRGLSKAYWLGSLRLGYCVASTGLTERIRTVLPPMLASSLSLRIARAVLGLGDIAQPLRDRIRMVKEEMVSLLRGAGFPVRWPSREYIPYVFCEGSDVEVRSGLESRGIIGKFQPFWSESTRTVTHRYRLSVPLSQARLELLQKKIGGWNVR